MFLFEYSIWLNMWMHTFYTISCTWKHVTIFTHVHIHVINNPKSLAINTTTNHTQDEAPIDQPRRLSLRRPSFKREIIANESFIDIQLKPVTKDKATPQKAEQKESSLTKVTRNWANYLFFCLPLWLAHLVSIVVVFVLIKFSAYSTISSIFLT